MIKAHLFVYLFVCFIISLKIYCVLSTSALCYGVDRDILCSLFLFFFFSKNLMKVIIRSLKKNRIRQKKKQQRREPKGEHFSSTLSPFSINSKAHVHPSGFACFSFCFGWAFKCALRASSYEAGQPGWLGFQVLTSPLFPL